MRLTLDLLLLEKKALNKITGAPTKLAIIHVVMIRVGKMNKLLYILVSFDCLLKALQIVVTFKKFHVRTSGLIKNIITESQYNTCSIGIFNPNN